MKIQVQDRMFSLEAFYQAYETDSTELVVNGRQFRILLPRYLSRFINPYDAFHEFPLWAKIWPASWLLAGYLAELPVAKGKKYLEIGAGVGFAGIVAAAFGHQITITEANADARQFARANAFVNDCPDVPVLELDWNRPLLQGRFDYIVGSEVAYKHEDLPALRSLFKTYLLPGGEIILTGEMRKTSADLYQELESMFRITVRKKILRSVNEEIKIFLFRMTFKGNGCTAATNSDSPG
jgi:predicted nicotinamide N-methyase